MSTTAQQIYEAAISLMDRRSQADGTAANAENQDYHDRTLDILNTIRHECYLASAFWDNQDPNGTVCPRIENFTSEIVGIDDSVAQGAMPYGLAYHLLLQEDPTSADYFRLKYEEMLGLLRAQQAADFEPIAPAYGMNEKGRFAWW